MFGVPYPDALAFGLWLILEIVLVAHHEPWRDEADAWLVSGTVSLRRLFQLTHYMGTPGLWYLVEMPFAKLGAPYWVQGSLNLAFAAAAAGLVLFRSPFPRLFRWCLIFAYFWGYELPVLARPYAMSILLFFVVAHLDGVRRQRPLTYAAALAAIPSTTVLGLGLSACLTALFGWECLRERPRYRRWLGFALASAGQMLAVLQIVPSPPDGQKPGGMAWQVKPFIADYAFRQAFFPLSTSGLLRVGVVALLILAALVLFRHRRPLLVWLGSTAYLLYVFSFVYASGPRHFSYLLWTLLVALWIARVGEGASPAPVAWEGTARYGRLLAWGLTLSFASSIRWTAISAKSEVTLEYSDSEIMGRYIRNAGLASRTIAAHEPAPTSAVLPYLPGKKLWYAGMATWGTHMNWDRAYLTGSNKDQRDVLANIRANFPNWDDTESGVLLLLNEPLADPPDSGYALLFATPHRAGSSGFGARHESYYLYRPTGRFASQIRP